MNGPRIRGDENGTNRQIAVRRYQRFLPQPLGHDDKRNNGIPDIVVAQNVAGTDDHETDKTLGDATSSIFKSATRCKRKSCIFKQFQTDAGEILE